MTHDEKSQVKWKRNIKIHGQKSHFRMGYKRCSKATPEEFQTQGLATENALFSNLIL